MCRDSFLVGLLQEGGCGSRELASWHSIGLEVPVVVLASSTDALSGIVAVTLSRDDFRDCDVRAQEASSCRCCCDTSMDGGGGGAGRTTCRGGGDDDEVGEQWSVVASVGAHDAVSECAVWVLLLRPSNKFNELVVVCNGCCDGCSGCACDGWSDEVKEALRELRLADFSLPSRLISRLPSRLLSAVEELLDFRGVVDLEPAFLVLRTDVDFVSDCCCCCTSFVAVRNNVSASSLLVFVVHVVAATGTPVESGSTMKASRTRRLVGEADSGAPCPLPLSNNRAARADVQAIPVKKLLLPSAPCSIFLAILLSKAARAEPILPFFMLKNQLTDYSPCSKDSLGKEPTLCTCTLPLQRERGQLALKEVVYRGSIASFAHTTSY
jgi:hypothetical protein